MSDHDILMIAISAGAAFVVVAIAYAASLRAESRLSALERAMEMDKLHLERAAENLRSVG